MGVIEVGTLIAVVGCFVGLAGWLSGRDKKITNDAQWRGGVDAKLDTILGIRVDVASIKGTVAEHGERLSKVETRVDSAHERIDRIERSENDNKER